MRQHVFVLLLMLLSQIIPAQPSAIKEPIKKLSSDLEQKYHGRDGAKIALLEFRTTDDRLLPFNAFIRDEMVLNYQGSSKFELIDPYMAAKIAAGNGWSMKKVSSFPFYEKLGQQFMEKTGYVPDAWIYGQIQDNEESITLTAYLVPTGSTIAKAIAAVSFPSDEQTDRLLGKPVKNRVKPKPEPDTIVIEHHIVIEKPEPQVPVFEPVPEAEPVADYTGNLPSADYEQFHLQLTSVCFIGEKLHIVFSVTNTGNIEKMLYITSYRSRIINNEGDEYQHPGVTLGSSESTHSVNKKMVPGITMKGELIFSKIPADLKIRLLEIGIQDEKITFKDLPVSR